MWCCPFYLVLLSSLSLNHCQISTSLSSATNNLSLSLRNVKYLSSIFTASLSFAGHISIDVNRLLKVSLPSSSLSCRTAYPLLLSSKVMVTEKTWVTYHWLWQLHSCSSIWMSISMVSASLFLLPLFYILPFLCSMWLRLVSALASSPSVRPFLALHKHDHLSTRV